MVNMKMTPMTLPKKNLIVLWLYDVTILYRTRSVRWSPCLPVQKKKEEWWATKLVLFSINEPAFIWMAPYPIEECNEEIGSQITVPS